MWAGKVPGRIVIKYRLEGNITLQNGQPPVTVNKTGTITSSMTDWKLMARPDCSIISYYIPDDPAASFGAKVPSNMIGNPDDAIVSFTIDTNDQSVHMKIAKTPEEALRGEVLAKVDQFIPIGPYKSLMGLFF